MKKIKKFEDVSPATRIAFTAVLTFITSVLSSVLLVLIVMFNTDMAVKEEFTPSWGLLLMSSILVGFNTLVVVSVAPDVWNVVLRGDKD